MDSVQMDKGVRTTDLKTSQSTERENKTTNPLSLLKEDFSQFKEDLMNVFKDKDMRTADFTSSQSVERENKTASPLSLLKEDFKEDLTNVFNTGFSRDKDMKTADLRTSQSMERENKTTNPLSLLKEDLSHFKEDLTNVFKIGLSKEKDCKAIAPKEDSSSALKVYSKTKAERIDASEDDLTSNLCRRDVSKTRGEKIQEFKKTLKEKRKERMTLSQMSRQDWTAALRINLSKKKEETANTGKMTDNKESELEDGAARELDINLPVEKTERTTSSETQLSEERIFASNTDVEKTTDTVSESKDCNVSDDPSMEDEEEGEEEDDNPLMSLSWEMPASGISLSMGNESNKDIMSGQSGGELQPVKKYACYLTLDPNTANPELLLSENNRRATRVWKDHEYLKHPERFQSCPQVLCREGLLERFYWEVEWSGGADIGVTYNSISRDGDVSSCLLGHNNKSWSLECSEGSYTPCHDNKRSRSSSLTPFNHTVGVYLDWAGGSLSFYSVSPEIMIHLHTFTTTFTEPLYPGFWVWGLGASVSLCQVEFEWERLLQ